MEQVVLSAILIRTVPKPARKKIKNREHVPGL